MDSEAELSVSEAELGADFITVELDTQPIEYVVKWAEVGSKFTISCLKTDQLELRTDDQSGLSDGLKRDDSESELTDALKKDDSESELTDALRVDQSQLQLEPEDSFLAPYEEVYCDPCEVTHSVEVRTDWDSDSDHATEVVLESSQPDSDQDRSESEERQYRCSYCGKTYSHASSLYRHQQSHTGAGKPPAGGKRQHHETRPHTCPHCGLSFKGSRMLGSHLRLHGKRRIHPCNICGKEFNHSSSLSRHRLIHKKGKGPSKDHPNMAALPNAAALHALKSPRKHRGKRSPASAPAPGLHKLYACPQCDMSFRTSTQLSKHQVTHVKALLGGYPPGKDKENLSETPSDLKIRLKLCSRDKPNVYALCEKRRRGTEPGTEPSDEDEEEEEEEEPGERRRHGCSQCGKRFGHASSLTRHLQTHLKTHLRPAQRRGNKTYTCLTCDKTFLHSSSFSRHKRAHREQQQRLAETAPIESDSE